MNEHFTEFLPMPETTQAAEGMPRRPWTVAEIEAMVRAGIISEDERFELIGGEVVPMLPKGGATRSRQDGAELAFSAHCSKGVVGCSGDYTAAR